MDLLKNQVDFRSLSLSDLLDARDQYHLHLLNKPNVVATAVGLYLIRETDPWPSRDRPDLDRRLRPRTPRTLWNSQVRPYSWPCVLAFVDRWVDDTKFQSPTDAVPKTLYLADGRVVPVCVVDVDPSAPVDTARPHRTFPDTVIGGGFPLTVRSQASEHEASVGCLMTDGRTVYALTNRHVSGRPGERISARVRGSEIEVGTSSELQITRKMFGEVYPGFAGSQSYLNMDIGLIEVDNLHDWTSSVLGIGPIGAVADLNQQNIGVQLIDAPVAAFGASSGLLAGKIKALFFRYKSVGGWDYVADLLIAPDSTTRQTLPGDSGTVWHLEVPATNGDSGHSTMHPLGIEWGGQAFGSTDGPRNFALATNLSNVCRLLDVEVVTDHNAVATPFWGKTGHYSIGRIAINEVKNRKVASLLARNADRIAFDLTTISDGSVDDLTKDAAFIPLADVPDLVWKHVGAERGGRDLRRGKGPEHPNHYCDIDEPGPNGGPSLRQLSMRDSANVSVEVWRSFYVSVKKTDSSSQGCLPFRVWQIFDEMVQFVADGDYVGFVAAAGILAHYVGDACQPLHGSVLADGDKTNTVTGMTSGGHSKEDWPGKGVHGAYETKMVDRHADELLTEMKKQLAVPWANRPKIKTGHEAAVETIALMDRSARRVQPAKLCQRYIALGEGTSQLVLDGLWDSFGKKTAALMVDGSRVLALLWESAWREGGGSAAVSAELVEFTEAKIRNRYRSATFLRSYELEDLGKVLSDP